MTGLRAGVTAPSTTTRGPSTKARLRGGADCVGAERVGKLRARGDLELAVDAREVDLDRLRRDEERLCDVLVRHVLGRHLRDTALARRERLEPTQHQAARPRTRRGELGLCALFERRRAELVRK